MTGDEQQLEPTKPTKPSMVNNINIDEISDKDLNIFQACQKGVYKRVAGTLKVKKIL
jgi:hypothetical protein